MIRVDRVQTVDDGQQMTEPALAASPNWNSVLLHRLSLNAAPSHARQGFASAGESCEPSGAAGTYADPGRSNVRLQRRSIMVLRVGRMAHKTGASIAVGAK